jgi:hypothetical protein
MIGEAYKLLAERLDSLPNGFPPAPDGVELRLLAKLFSPEEAYLASNLKLTLETAEQIADRIGSDRDSIIENIEKYVQKGFDQRRRTDQGLGSGLLPFVVGIYEMQINNIDEELAIYLMNITNKYLLPRWKFNPHFIELSLSIKAFGWIWK